MKSKSVVFVFTGVFMLILAMLITGCGGTVPQPAPTEEPTEAPIEIGEAARAVDLIGAWVDSGAPETEAFEYTGLDGNTYQATFDVDILPMFTSMGFWFEGSLACAGCHFDVSETSYHEMDLSSYEGILTGADALEDPPGESLLGESQPGAGDFDWEHSELRARLRNNRMPPGWLFDISEENRDGPCVTVSGQGVEVQTGQYDCELHAVGLIGAWVEAGAPDGEFAFGDATLTFERDVLPFFTTEGIWFDGSQACSGCHFAVNEASQHEMDLTSYEGILTGADALEDPPGESLLGESQPGAGDFDWEHSLLRGRLRDNRMVPGFPFDITEENRDGPTVVEGSAVSVEN